MQAFYKKLCAVPQGKGTYWHALNAITKATQTQVHTIASEFSWQSWSEAEKHVQE